jgi:acetyl-CoA carboxylase biotin carboxyl carrier protein
MKKRNDTKEKSVSSMAASLPAAKAAAAKKPDGKAVGARPAQSGGIDLATVRELAQIADEMNLSEIEADPSGHIRVRRRVGRKAGEARPIARAAAPIALAPAPAAAAGAAAVEPGTFITSPFVGTFYRAPSPDASPFVEPGDTVRKGQVVCIVEAMKLMNEIEAEADGKVLEIMVKNGEHVEYGQSLLRLAKG